jgi:hypothetical protein
MATDERKNPCQCGAADCTIDLAPGVPFVHVVQRVDGPSGPARIDSISLAHLYNLQRAAADAAGADKGTRKAK